MSAVLINGQTLHSVFKIPRNAKDYKPLTGQRARDLCNILSNVKFIILDEFSMIGCKTLALIDRRCKEATGNHGEDFGGLNIWLLGDIKQLPAVKDNAFFSKTQQTKEGKEGYGLINNFQKTCFLTTCHRQQDIDFLKVLDRISECNPSNLDYQTLSSRFTTNVSVEEKNSFENAMRLFATRDEVDRYNLQKLADLKDGTGNSVPVLKVKAQHNCNAAKAAGNEDAEGLEKTLYLAKGCEIMLRTNLWIGKKLCNGTQGKIHDILFDPTNHMPSLLLCEFYCYDGPSLIPESNIIPIKPILKSWTDKKGNLCSRYQFPITLSYACSIHKSQGMTLDKVVIIYLLL